MPSDVNVPTDIGDIQPLVSIGVPVRNGAPLIDRTMRTLRAQTWSNLEILVSDNGSTDATPEILERHAAEDSRIELQRVHPHDRDIDNFNRVLHRATGEYFMWAAHDDEWAPDHIERLVKILQGDPSVALAAPITDAIDLEGNVIRSYDRVTDLQDAGLMERLVAFIEQPEPEGKGACLMYSLFRRTDVAAMDLVAFWGADSRRQDYHIVLAVFLLGRLQVDPDLRFRKTAMPLPRRSVVKRVTDGVKYTRMAANWIAAYPRVIEERIDLTPEQRRTIQRAADASRRRYFRARARSVLRTLFARPERADTNRS